MVRKIRPLASGNCITHERRGQWVCLRGKSGSLAMLAAIQQKARRQFGIVQFIAHLKAV